MKPLLPSLLLLLCSLTASAAELQPFDHQYELYRGDTRIAKARMRLYPQQEHWVWELKTQPLGWLRLLTSKRPFSSTWLRNTPDGPSLMLQLSGDYPDKPSESSTWFDETRKRLYYVHKKTSRQRQYQDPVHDYLSIHLLYPELFKAPDHQLEADYYQKGKIQSTFLKLEPDVTLRSGDRTLVLDRVTQTLPDSDKYMVYYYRRGDIAPVKIEQYKGKTEKSVMWRSDVK